MGKAISPTNTSQQEAALIQFQQTLNPVVSEVANALTRNENRA